MAVWPYGRGCHSCSLSNPVSSQTDSPTRPHCHNCHTATPAMTRRIPIFPLHVVLFPGMPLPLHVFEARYQEMMAECLQGDRTFGVCLIRSGQEVGGPAEP